MVIVSDVTLFFFKEILDKERSVKFEIKFEKLRKAEEIERKLNLSR